MSTSSPLRVSVIPTSRGSTAESGTIREDTAKAPLEARSATVSASLIRQSWNRESTISTDAHTPATAAAASVTSTPGPASREPITAMISASIFGWISVAIDTVPPSTCAVEPRIGAKSGESTPIICCIGLEVSPTL